MAQLARGAEVQGLAIDPAVKNNGGIAQGTKGHRHGYAGNHVVDDFVPDQHRQGVGPAFTIDSQAHHGLGRGKCLGRRHGDKIRLVDGWYLILAHAARHDVVKGHGMLLEIGPWPFTLPLARSGLGLSEDQNADDAGQGGDGQNGSHGTASIVTSHGRPCSDRAQITAA